MSATVARMTPNQPRTPMLAVRVPEEVQEAIAARAQADGVTKTDVVRAALEAYLRGGQR